MPLPVLLVPPAIVVDASVTQPISPYVYGGNFTDWPSAGRAVTLDRQGGNRLPAYNRENDASNDAGIRRRVHGRVERAGLTPRRFMQAAQANGAATLLTVPTMGHVSTDKGPVGDVDKTPNYLQTRLFRSFSRKKAPFVYPPSLTDRTVF